MFRRILITEIVLIQVCIGNSAYGRKSPALSADHPRTQELIVYRDSQVLYNGRIWYRKHSNVRGNEFFESALWNRGDVIISGHSFRNNDLRYDILNDELLIRRADGLILILNSQIISDFILFTGDKSYHFRNFRNKKEAGITGYANVLYDGKTSLLLKPVKEILPLGYQKIEDIFIQTDYLYVMKNGIAGRIKGFKGLLDFLGDKRKEIRSFIRANRIDLFAKEPENLIPVLKYYDSLSE